jgi:hypothetical protein
MNFQNLLERKPIFIDPKVEIASQLQGALTNRKLGKVFGSSLRFYRLHDKGRLLAEYSKEPKLDSEPKEVINVCEIEDLKEETIDGESLIAFSVQEQAFKLRADEKNAHKKWMNALGTLTKFYAKEVPRYSRRLGEKIEPEIEAQVRAELEDINWPEVKLKIDKTSFVRDKGLKPSFDKLKALKNRLFIVEVKVEVRNAKQVAVEKEPSSPLAKISGIWKKKESSDSLDGKDCVVLLVSQKKAYEIDEVAAENDFEVLKTAQIPSSLDFNSLIFYQYLSPGDETVSRMRIPVA